MCQTLFGIPMFGSPFNLLALLIGAAVTALIIYFNFKERREQQAHGLAEEPNIIFMGRNLLIAAAFLGFTFLMARYKGLPNVLIVMFALIALFVFLTTRTTFGRRVYAMGGNEKAAKLSGINTERMTFMIFVIMGALAALAGLVFAARLNVATPKAGAGFELEVIAACFIGGAAVTGGVGKIIGAVIGAFIIGVMNNGMSIMGVGIDWQFVIKGAVLMLAVFLDVYYKNKAPDLAPKKGGAGTGWDCTGSLKPGGWGIGGTPTGPSSLCVVSFSSPQCLVPPETKPLFDVGCFTRATHCTGSLCDWRLRNV